MEFTGSLTTSNELINKLQENIQWGQRGNFLDVPTDCPQRDERLGWTGMRKHSLALLDLIWTSKTFLISG